MNGRLVAGVAILALGAAGIWGYTSWRSGSEAAGRRAAILRAVEDELAADEKDTDELSMLLRRIAREREETTEASPELRRAEARIRLALGDPNDAWALIGDAALDPDAEPLDRWIGARVLMRLHAEQGDRGKGSEALGLARAYYDSTADVAGLFAAWQLAYRIDAPSDWLELGALLRDRHPDSLEAETAMHVEHFLAQQLATRLGMDETASAEDVRTLADTTADDAFRRLLERYLATADSAESASMESMFEYVRRWGDEAPPELSVLLAQAQVRQAIAENRQEDLHLAVDMLDGALEKYPTFVEARHWNALAHYGLEDYVQQQSYLRWLLENAPERDARRPGWQQRFRR